MVELRYARNEELPLFVRMEQAADTAEFVFGWDVERHSEEFGKDEVIYLSIIAQNKLAGFFILALEPDGKTVEFRRIVVDPGHRGIGQSAIRRMEDFCRKELELTHIWLDVKETNSRGMHIYEKLGYAEYKKGIQDGEVLCFYKKNL